MDNTQEESMDDIIRNIRMAIITNERNTYFQSFYRGKRPEDDVFVLSKKMLVKREDIPYKLGVWSFDDVAKKMMKKYRHYFNAYRSEAGRVRVKEENKA